MSKIETGGAAFPQDYERTPMNGEGMTLRDYFAAKALGGMTGDCDSPSNREGVVKYAPQYAKAAYALADAMIAARSK